MSEDKLRFTGISILNIPFCGFHGYGFELLRIKYDIIKGIGYSRTLLGFNAHPNKQNEGRVWDFILDILFFKFKFKRTIIKPKHYCYTCHKLFEHDCIIVDKYGVFCSTECKDEY